MKVLVIELTKKFFYSLLCMLFIVLGMGYVAFGIVVHLTEQSSFVFLLFFLFGGLIGAYPGYLILESLETWLFPEYDEPFELENE